MYLRELLLEFSVRNIQPGLHDYQSANRLLYTLRKKKGDNENKVKLPSTETYLVRDTEDRSISVFYHGTAVITYHHDGAITINTGGYDTVSTRKLISEYLPRHISLVRNKNANYISIGSTSTDLDTVSDINDFDTPASYAAISKRRKEKMKSAHKWTSRQAVITPDGEFIQEE